MREAWDSFVDASRNATFLFKRGYMEYHSDRFADCSWTVWKKNRLIALLPADLTSDGVLRSHGGLTYGGWILPVGHLDGSDLLEIFRMAASVWRGCGIRELDYKPLPWIYSLAPSQEDLYALFRMGAVLTECTLSSTISMRTGWLPNKMQKRHLKSAMLLNPVIAETDDIPGFMTMLAECLRERHDTAPVHTPSEMQLLKRRFPDNIRFFTASVCGEVEAGVCIYDTGLVAHAQYIATTPRGRECNLLTPLFHKLITETFAARSYFDFGISNENHGLILNAGLHRQKSSYGASGTACLRYRLSL